jgi:hypothetical protein
VPLTAQLQASFGANGFDFTASVGGLASVFEAVSPAAVSLDSSATGNITDLLNSLDLGAVTALLQPVLVEAGKLVRVADLGALQAIEGLCCRGRPRHLRQPRAGILEVLTVPAPPRRASASRLRASLGGLASLPSGPVDVGSLLITRPRRATLDIGAPGSVLGGSAAGSSRSSAGGQAHARRVGVSRDRAVVALVAEMFLGRSDRRADRVLSVGRSRLPALVAPHLTRRR